MCKVVPGKCGASASCGAVASLMARGIGGVVKEETFVNNLVADCESGRTGHIAARQYLPGTAFPRGEQKENAP